MASTLHDILTKEDPNLVQTQHPELKPNQWYAKTVQDFFKSNVNDFVCARAIYAAVDSSDKLYAYIYRRDDLREARVSFNEKAQEIREKISDFLESSPIKNENHIKKFWEDMLNKFGGLYGENDKEKFKIYQILIKNINELRFIESIHTAMESGWKNEANVRSFIELVTDGVKQEILNIYGKGNKKLVKTTKKILDDYILILLYEKTIPTDFLPARIKELKDQHETVDVEKVSKLIGKFINDTSYLSKTIIEIKLKFKSTYKDKIFKKIQDKVVVLSEEHFFQDENINELREKHVIYTPDLQHTWMGNLGWLLANLRKGRIFRIKGDVLNEKNKSRSRKPKEISAFFKEICGALKAGYTLERRDTDFYCTAIEINPKECNTTGASGDGINPSEVEAKNIFIELNLFFSDITKKAAIAIQEATGIKFAVPTTLIAEYAPSNATFKLTRR
jgi:hypothetical protein